MDILQWIFENKYEIIEAILALIGFASIVVRWTPTPKDDEVLGKIKRFISKYFALNPDESIKICIGKGK